VTRARGSGIRLNPNVTAAVVVLAVFVAAALAMHHVSHRIPRAPFGAASDTLAPVSESTPPADRRDAAR